VHGARTTSRIAAGKHPITGVASKLGCSGTFTANYDPSYLRPVARHDRRQDYPCLSLIGDSNDALIQDKGIHRAWEQGSLGREQEFVRRAGAERRVRAGRVSWPANDLNQAAASLIAGLKKLCKSQARRKKAA